jgi:hypothetical protein
MAKHTFARSPYPDVHVSDEQRQSLVQLVNGCVQDHFAKFERFVVQEQHQVDDRRWEHVKSRDDLHVYSERPEKELVRHGLGPTNASPDKDMAVMLSVGTFVGEMHDLLFGALNTTRDAMRIKTSYVQDLDNGAILCPVVEPSEEEPFRSLTIKWMTLDESSSLKRRDFVCIEATDVLQLANGETIGFHLLHSLEFPQTKPLPDFIRGNISSISFYRQVHRTIIDNFGSCIIDPGVKARKMLFVPAVASSMLAATNFVRCGQMKKLSWMLRRHQSVAKLQEEAPKKRSCVMCAKFKPIGMSTCRLCYGRVCYTCKVREQVSFIAVDGQLTQRKITFCSPCMSKAINSSTVDAARDQALGCEQYKGSSTFSDSSSTFADSASTFSASTYSESSSYYQ